VAAHGAVPASPPDALAIAVGWAFEPLVAIPLAALALGWLEERGDDRRESLIA
jgi:hypothetical protein